MTLSDPMLGYVLEARPLHAALREALIQVSAFALIRATHPIRSLVDIGPLDRARSALAEPTEAIAALRVPADAAHHHHHIKSAATALERALAAGYSSRDGNGDALFAAVEDAEHHVRAAGRLLPGFEIVDLAQACCAAHAPAAPATQFALQHRS